MNRINKIIKFGSLMAVLSVIFFAAVALSPAADFPAGERLNFFLPLSRDRAKFEPEKKLNLLFLGDLMIDRHVGEKIAARGLASLFQDLTVSGFFDGFNLVNANLEGAVTDGGAHYPPAQAYDFAFAPKLVAELKDYGFNAFNLANNHLTDQGEKGVKETEKNLAGLGYKYYGCGDALTGECSTAVAEANGFKIGLAGFSQVYKKFDLAAAKKIVADLKARTDLVIVNLHWGVEYEHQFNKIQQTTGRELIDAGADLIIGHHPHVVQGMEIYQGKPIFYSLGNFIFDQYFSADTQEELAVAAEIGAEKHLKLRLLPLLSEQSRPALMPVQAKEKYLAKIADWSEGDKELMEQIKKGEININLSK